MGEFKKLKQEIEEKNCRFLSKDTLGNIYCRAIECYYEEASCIAKDNKINEK